MPAFWVNSAGTSVSCQASYTTIGAAVTAAESYESNHPGRVPVVNICPGTYSEQVTVTKSLVLTRAPVRPGLGPVTIQLPASVGSDRSQGLSTTNCQANDASGTVPQSVLEVCAAGTGGTNTTGTTVSVSNVTVAGNWSGVSCTSESLSDILVEGGAKLDLADSRVEKAGVVNPLSGCQMGIGLQAGNSTTNQIGHADLTRDTIETYEKGGVAIKGSGSTGNIDHSQIIGAGPTPAIAQNGIEFVNGATGTVTSSSVSGNGYTGSGNTSSAGILTYGCGSATVNRTRFTGDRITNNDVGIWLNNYDTACTQPATTSTGDVACNNVIQNSHGYPNGTASSGANLTGWSSTTPQIGYQAGIADTGNHDVICDNAISGPGYAPLGTLPTPAPPAFVRPVDTVSAPTTAPQVYGNTYDGRPYRPS